MRLEFEMHRIVGVVEHGRLRLEVRRSDLNERTDEELRLIIGHGTALDALIEDVRLRWNRLMFELNSEADVEERAAGIVRPGSAT